MGATRTEHGTRSRYQVGCRCSRCRAANTAYTSRRRELGWKPARVPVDDVDSVRQLLEELGSGWVAREYANHYGGNLESLRKLLGRIHRGEVRTVLPKTVEVLDRVQGLFATPEPDLQRMRRLGRLSPLAERIIREREQGEGSG